MTSAFAYLMARTMRNRLVSMARRVRQPRYAIGFLFVIAYLGFMAWGTITGYGRGAASRSSALHSDVARTVVPAILALLLVANWIGGNALTALAFTQAEVAMLFPAPVSRRALILFKVARAQIPILFNVAIIMVLWGAGASVVPRWLNALGLYTMFATTHLNRVGAALVRVSTMKYGRAAMKRNWLSYVIGAIVAVTMFLAFLDVQSSAGPLGNVGEPFVTRVTTALSVPWVHAVLTPFALISAPALARTPAEWGVAFVGALAMLGLHLLWVLRSHTAFEEAASEQSERLHAMRESFRKRGIIPQRQTAPSLRLTIPLRPTGHPALAIIWKNSLTFIRTFRPTQLLLVLSGPALAGGFFGAKAGDPFAAVAGVSAMFALVLLLAGGMTARNDLRGDLVNLSALKTFPLPGREIVLAEVSSSALPLAIMQCLLLWVAIVSLQVSKHPMPMGMTLALFVTLPVGLAGLNLLTSTIHNGVAVLFPAWTRLGSDGGAGLEMIGQAMLAVFAMFLGFLVLMIVPSFATFVVLAWVKPPAIVALSSSMILGAAAIVGESYLLMIWLGKALEHTEPSASLSSS